MIFVGARFPLLGLNRELAQLPSPSDSARCRSKPFRSHPIGQTRPLQAYTFSMLKSTSGEGACVRAAGCSEQ